MPGTCVPGGPGDPRTRGAGVTNSPHRPNRAHAERWFGPRGWKKFSVFNVLWTARADTNPGSPRSWMGCTEFLPHGHRQPELESHRPSRGHFLPLGSLFHFPSLSALTFWAGAFESLQESSAKSTPDLLRAGYSGGMNARLNELMSDKPDPYDSQPVSLESQPLCRVAELGCDAGLLFLLLDPTQAPGSVSGAAYPELGEDKFLAKASQGRGYVSLPFFF